MDENPIQVRLGRQVPHETIVQIMDFSHAENDRIDVSGIDANASLSGNQTFAYIGSNGFSAAGQLRFQYDSAGNYGVLSSDSNGDNTADFAVKLMGVQTLSAADMVL